MPRNKCPRTVNCNPNVKYYKPQGIPLRELDEVILELDEVEAIRLSDLHGLYYNDAAKQMNISRQTFGRIIEMARNKIADAILNGKAIKISSELTSNQITNSTIL